MMRVNQYEAEVRRFLGPQGPLAQSLDHYEHRPEQAEMAAAALRALDRESILLVEAGTGTGKTLAYLVPALYSGRKVIISTGTKALQEQLINKDLPVLTKQFHVSAALMKGRGNYLCLRRFAEFNREPVFSYRDEITVYDRVVQWAGQTPFGDRAEIKGLPDDFSAWREISASSEQCLGMKCPKFKECFVTKMRARAAEAEIVVVNHHLFFADLAVRGGSPGQVIPSYGTVIFDEAHALAEIATEYFGAAASSYRMIDLGRDIRRIQRLGRLAVDNIRDMIKALERAEVSSLSVFKTVENAGRNQCAGRETGRFSLANIVSLPEVIEETERAGEDLQMLSDILATIGKDDENSAGLADRALALARDLSFIVKADDPDHVYWAESRGKSTFLRASPTELGPILGPTLFEPKVPLIFTSATLAVTKKGKWEFSHFKKSLGLDQPEFVPRPVEEVWLPSSYDWKNNAVLYVPKDLPDPTRPEFIIQAADRIEKILAVSAGRAFLLFTSYRNLEAAHRRLADRLPYLVLKQGEASKQEILDQFRADGNAVLFATQSFWEGVDVSGSALSCVVVDKLPFDSPGDPLICARIDRIRKKKGDPFNDFQLPSAVISLKQGLGRLIRNRTDYGILSVLDHRLLTRRYGSSFLDSLPPVPLTYELETVRKFMAKHEG